MIFHRIKASVLRMLLSKVMLVMLGIATFCPSLQAEQLSIAVASNFQTTLSEIARLYQKQTGHSIKVIPGSTGKHFAQISHGAPFDLFFAADARRPQLLDQKKMIVPGSRFTYAIGKLALFSPDKSLPVENGEVLDQSAFQYLAIANPRLAPYGKAAQQYLTQTKRWGKLRSKMVRGENIGQTWQYVKSGNAQIGLVAFSQVLSSKDNSNYWLVPEDSYTPIEQQAVILKDSPTAQDFLNWFKSDQVQQIIHRYGYRTDQ